MTAYKEIFVSIPTYNPDEFYSMQTPVQTPFEYSSQVSSKSYITSVNLESEVINIIATGTKFSVESFCTKSQKDGNLEDGGKISRTTFSLIEKSDIVGVPVALQRTLTNFIVIYFTVDGEVVYYEFNKDFLDQPSTIRATDKTLAEISAAEFLSSEANNEYAFAIGDKKGEISVFAIAIEKNHNTISIRETTSRSIVGMNMLYSLFTKNDKNKSKIDSLKFFNNYLVFFIRKNASYGVFDIKKKKITYEGQLTSDEGDRLSSSKILTKIISDDLTKKFQIITYINYANIYELNTMELWITGDQRGSFLSTRTSLEKSFAEMDLGTNFLVKNLRSYTYSAPIIDIAINQNQVLVAISNSEKDPSLGEIRCIFTVPNPNDNSDFKFPSFSENKEVSILIKEAQLKNLQKIIDQVHLTCSDRCSFNKKFISYISLHKELFPDTSLINLIKKNYNQEKTGRKEAINFLMEKFSENSEFLVDQKVMNIIIQEEIENNKLLGFGTYNTDDITSLALVREKSVSVLKKISSFELLEQYITDYEQKIRKIILDDDRINSVNYDNSLEKDLKLFMSREILFNESNATLFALALVRVYLTDIFIVLEDKEEIYSILSNDEDFVNPKRLESFIEVIFHNPKNNKASLDFLTQILFELFVNNKPRIVEDIQIIKEAFLKHRDGANKSGHNYETYSAEIMISDDITEKNYISPFIAFNISEIITQMVSNQITSSYKLARDILGFLEWKVEYLRVSQNKDEFSSINTVDVQEFDEDLKENLKALFFENLSCFTLANYSANFEGVSLSGINKETVKSPNKETTFLGLYIAEKLSSHNKKLQTEKSNEIVILLANSFIKQIMLNREPNCQYEIYNIVFSQKSFPILSLVSYLQSFNEENKIIFLFLNVIEISTLNDNKRPVRRDQLFERTMVDNSISDNENRTIFYDDSDNYYPSRKFNKILSEFYLYLLNINCSPEHVKKLIQFCVKMNFAQIDGISTISSLLLKGYLLLERLIKLKVFSINGIDPLRRKNILSTFYLYSFSYIFSVFSSNIDEVVSQPIYEQHLRSFMRNVFEACLERHQDTAIRLLGELSTNTYALLFEKVKDDIADVIINFLMLEKEKSQRYFLIEKLKEYTRNFLEYICEILKTQTEKTGYTIRLFQKEGEEKTTNYYKVLIYLYIQLGKYSLCAEICSSYIEAIKSLIQTDSKNISEIKDSYDEMISVCNDAIICLEKEIKNNYRDIIQDDVHCNAPKVHSYNKLLFKKSDLEIEKKLMEIKYFIFDFYIKKVLSKSEIPPFGEEKISKIKQDDKSYLLNLIFQLRLYEVAIKFEIIICLKSSEVKLFIFNMCKALTEEKLYQLLHLFVKQIMGEEMHSEYQFILLDYLIFFNVESEIHDIISVLCRKNCLRVVELLLKYQKFEIVCDLINFMNLTGQEIPTYLFKNITTYFGRGVQNQEVNKIMNEAIKDFSDKKLHSAKNSDVKMKNAKNFSGPKPFAPKEKSKQKEKIKEPATKNNTFGGIKTNSIHTGGGQSNSSILEATLTNSNLFGNTQSNSNNLGGTDPTKTEQSNSIFGAQKPKFSFGGPQQSNAPSGVTQQASYNIGKTDNLFGGLSGGPLFGAPQPSNNPSEGAQQNKSIFGDPQQSSSLFGGSQQNNNLFSQTNNNNAGGTSIFDNQKSNNPFTGRESTNKPPEGSLFGNSTVNFFTSQNKSLFEGHGNTKTGSGSLFG